MPKMTKATIEAKGIEISVQSVSGQDDYISLTDIAKFRDNTYPGYIIQNWLRRRATIEYIGIWEQLNNPNFNCIDFEAIKNEAGSNGFVMTPKRWIEATGAIGIISKQGRYAATYAHMDIAMEFASWISPEFKLYIIKDYQRLKKDEGHRQQLEWNAKRELSKANYRIHTDAIKAYLLPETLSPQQINFTYATEADMLNVALFNMTARQWREQNPDLTGNIRDYADIYQLIVLVNPESMNAELIKREMPQKERLIYLRKMVREQMTSLINSASVQRLSETLNLNTIALPKKSTDETEA